MRTVLISVVLAVAGGAAAAKLPPLSEEAKVKAAETAARNAYNDKVAAFQLCKSMDRVAAVYYADAKKAGREAKPPVPTAACADPGPFVYPPPAAASAPGAPAVAAAPAAPAASPAPAPAKK